MNEAMRCDRISLMNAGKVLAQDTPAAIIRSKNAPALEDAFIAYLEEATRGDQVAAAVGEEAPTAATPSPAPRDPGKRVRFSPRRLWAYARREAMEIRRDRLRLGFALFLPLVLMLLFSYGISFDIENLAYAVLDNDRTPESRTYLDEFAHSRYFREQPPITDYAELERRLQSGELKLAVEIPTEFGKDLRRGRPPEVSVWLDGSVPFRADTSRSYVEVAHQHFLTQKAARNPAPALHDPSQWPVRPTLDIEARLRYNQGFVSAVAEVPGTIMLLLMLIPASLAALGVVREKEVGSIVNLYASPATGTEFLLGKQLPYVVLGLVNFVCLVLLAVYVLHVPLKGSLQTLSVGAVLYVIAATGFGLLLSTVVRTQIAAIFAIGVLTVLPAVQFSGLLTPVSSLSPWAKITGLGFPSTYFQQVSVGTFTKALAFGDLTTNLLALALFAVGYIGLSCALLRTQET
jgi:ribosome-dependent ATPase